jgi:ABC-type Mn2+/Zn2+ transport system ATPase subunit/DNA repair exonuclease SbcCD nuclease subunit
LTENQQAMLLFSDLHLSPKTFRTSLQVLRRVHAEAVRRNVTIGFLGDFFDHVYNKGTLQVDILNELLRFFEKEWTVPMVMIPGNHDYFDASETEHGLTPFQYASPHITVLDKPTVIDRQLWVPWRRCNETVANILRKHTDVDVIFGHFDIIGFKLNPTKISTEGLESSVFPIDKAIYTGHYHTPQVHGNIRYLGSPYQLSLSEAEDEKSLIVIDPQYQVAEMIPISIGPKQFKWSVAELTTRSHLLQPEDRVTVTAEVNERVLALVHTLEERGVCVQVRKKSAPVTTRIEKNNSPKQLFQQYAEIAKVDVESVLWKRVLKWVEEHPSVRHESSALDVRPVKMEVSGFGPFKGVVSLALEGQGFTLISGECNGQKESSNGAGKSMLAAGAFLWACTGRIDGRGTLSFGGSIINSESKDAVVMVSGTVNGCPWKIRRTLSQGSRGRKQQLYLSMDGKDCTRSTLAATQKAIAADLFGLEMTAGHLQSWLLNNCVWSQMSVPRWLDATDAQAKNEISPLANMELWLALYEKAKQMQKKAKRVGGELNHQLALQQERLSSVRKVYQEQLEAARGWQEKQDKRVTVARKELEKARVEVSKCVVPGKPDVVRDSRALKKSVEQKRMQLATLKAKLSILPPFVEGVVEKEGEVRTKKKLCEDSNRTFREAEVLFNQCRRELSHFQAKGECATCRRTFQVDEDCHVQLKQRKEKALVRLGAMKKENEKAMLSYKEADVNEKQWQNNCVRRRLEHEQVRQTKELAEMIHQIEMRREEEQQYISDKQNYQLALELFQHVSSTLQQASRLVQQLENATCPFRACDKAIVTLEAVVEKLRRLQQSEIEEVEDMKKVVAWVGPRGIQTYAMEYAVQKLSALTTEWLKRLFKTDDIALNAYFDEKERLIRRVETAKHAGIMSGGQWRRAQLASFLAWREMSTYSFPLLVMDEACASMDLVGIQAVQQTLRDWCDENQRRTCLFITHEQEQHRDTSAYQNHVRILQKRGRSSILEQGVPTKKRKVGHSSIE